MISLKIICIICIKSPRGAKPSVVSLWVDIRQITYQELSRIAKFMGPTWGSHGSCQPQMGPMLVPWTLLSGKAPGMWFVWYPPKGTPHVTSLQRRYVISAAWNSLTLGRFRWNLSKVQAYLSHWWLWHLLWNCPHRLGNGLVPPGNKLLPEPMLAKFLVVIWCH